MSSNICFVKVGSGPLPVIVLHDWFCDHSSWDPLLPYLTLDRFTYFFCDLRGYGASRKKPGSYTLEEAVKDVVALADVQGFNQFALIAHSMSTVVAQRVAQLAPQRLTHLVLVTPVAPAGMKSDAPTVEFFQSVAMAEDEERFARLAPLWGERYSEAWARFKLRRWRKTAQPEAAAQYVEMWACADISSGARGVKAPVMIVAGVHDAPPFKPDALRESMMPYYPHAQVIEFTESGHYPMQEQPPLLATVVERFLGKT
jgi:pimeloyl-ACP methyl ester carboxylesterase